MDCKSLNKREIDEIYNLLKSGTLEQFIFLGVKKRVVIVDYNFGEPGELIAITARHLVEIISRCFENFNKESFIDELGDFIKEKLIKTCA